MSHDPQKVLLLDGGAWVGVITLPLIPSDSAEPFGRESFDPELTTEGLGRTARRRPSREEKRVIGSARRLINPRPHEKENISQEALKAFPKSSVLTIKKPMMGFTSLALLFDTIKW